jgi:hypothetical protein
MNWILTSDLPFSSIPNTFWWVPYVADICFSFSGTDMDERVTGVKIYKEEVYCYFFV